MKMNRWNLRWIGRAPGLAALVLLCFGAAARTQEDGSTEVVPGMEDACIENLGYNVCENGMPKPPGGQQVIVVHYAAVALSPSTMSAGPSHGQNSQSCAEQAALQTCQRNGAKDCKVLTWGRTTALDWQRAMWTRCMDSMWEAAGMSLRLERLRDASLETAKTA